MINTIKNKFIGTIFSLISFLLFAPTFAFAIHGDLGGGSGTGDLGGGSGSGSGGNISNPLKFDSIQDFLVALLDVIILISVPIIVLFMIYAGFLFVTSQGSEDKLNTAKKVILYTIIGAVIILGAKAIATAIESTVNELSNLPQKQLVLRNNTFNL